MIINEVCTSSQWRNLSNTLLCGSVYPGCLVLYRMDESIDAYSGDTRSPASAATRQLQCKAELLWRKLSTGDWVIKILGMSLEEGSIYCFYSMLWRPDSQHRPVKHAQSVAAFTLSSKHKLPTPGHKDSVHWTNYPLNEYSYWFRP